MAQAETNGGRLEMTQVLDCFAQDAVTPEEMEEVYARLEKRGIQVLSDEGAETPGDEGLLLEDEDDSDEAVSDLIGSR